MTYRAIGYDERKKMVVYVLDRDGNPLMPTKRCGWVAYALKHGEAKVVRRDPFTIQILRESTRYLQEVTLGIDVGSRHIGLSATTKKEELYSAQVELRTDVSELLTARRELRRGRRGRRHNWYRPARWANRANHLDKDLPPSIKHKADSHIRSIKFVCKMLPIGKVRVEIGKFDTQKIQNPEIHNEQYQNGTLAGWENLKAYAKWRDGYKCRVCGKSSKKDTSVRLEVHHVLRRADGGSDTPDNVVTLCHECHEAHHQKKKVLKFKNPPTHKNEAHMNSMRQYLREAIFTELDYRYVKQEYTYGYETAMARREHGIEKSHSNDAYCIAGNFNAVHNSHNVYLHKFVRRHNRKLHKASILKGGIRKENQAQKYVHGYRLFDSVRYKGMDCFVFGRRSSGSFDIRRLDGTRISAGVSYKRLTPLTKSTTIMTERRVCNSTKV